MLSKLYDPNGHSDYIKVHLLTDKLKEIIKVFPFDAVISTSEPYSAAAAASSLKNVKKILYLMDPPNMICGNQDTQYRKNTISTVLSQTDVIVTTPFIAEALKNNQLLNNANIVIPAGFPMISGDSQTGRNRSDGKIRLLFCGWLYSDIRSPKYFLDIVSHLDDRFEITFMGRECEKLKDRFEIHSKAKIITLPQQPYEEAIQAMNDADILINIGNSVPVHMPSKTLEYINTGKPIVNFYKFDNCPTLYYTKRYPLALNLFEGETDIKAVTERLKDFCLSNFGNTVDRNWILKEYEDCTAQYIAEKIKEAIGN